MGNRLGLGVVLRLEVALPVLIMRDAELPLAFALTMAIAMANTYLSWALDRREKWTELVWPLVWSIVPLVILVGIGCVIQVPGWHGHRGQFLLSRVENISVICGVFAGLLVSGRVAGLATVVVLDLIRRRKCTGVVLGGGGAAESSGR